MAVLAETRPLHPLHAMLLGFPLALFAGAWLADLAYWSSYEIQWANFAAWLNAFGMIFATLVLLWSLAGFVRGPRRGRRAVYLLLVLAMWVLGLVAGLVHARDAWGIMPLGLWLSAIVALLALAAAWIGYSGLPAREAR
ncbi:DUF2231 domain-containing protein [Sphingosinicella terrae]|uniref:DUF2231 domain-containing protein n=1 Tax=Sphingosinicella terrae TaxID=2172047 RepID=UPI0025486494|nr:DUF2231 domain-containing protein [Sphingosinicella terrae]